jgi:hypothetical protein
LDALWWVPLCSWVLGQLSNLRLLAFRRLSHSAHGLLQKLRVFPACSLESLQFEPHHELLGRIFRQLKSHHCNQAIHQRFAQVYCSIFGVPAMQILELRHQKMGKSHEIGLSALSA